MKLQMKVDSFSWPRTERICDRYGAFLVNTDPTVLFPDMIAKQVKVTVEVLQVNECLHIGDMFHGFGHTVPEVGEVHVLAIGKANVEPCDDKFAIAIHPTDGRDTFWIDPMLLYRLCQQTVLITIEETTEPDMPYPFWMFKGSEQPDPDWWTAHRAKREQAASGGQA